MNITNESRKLMSFFVEHECLMPIKQTNKTRTFFKNIYNEIHSGVSYIQNIKEKMGSSFYKLIKTVQCLNYCCYFACS